MQRLPIIGVDKVQVGKHSNGVGGPLLEVFIIR